MMKKIHLFQKSPKLLNKRSEKLKSQKLLKKSVKKMQMECKYYRIEPNNL